MKVAAIVAIDKNWAIGRQGGLLCHLPADLRHFKSVTMGYPIIMGRKTFESFPRGPLPGRLNIVLTHNDDYRPSGVTVCHNMNEALAIAQAEGRDRCYIIGGGSIYALFAFIIDEIYLTQIHSQFDDADTFFPPIDQPQWEIVEQEDFPADERNSFPYSFIHLKRKIHSTEM